MAAPRASSSNQAIRGRGRRKRTTAVARGWWHQLELTERTLSIPTYENCEILPEKLTAGELTICSNSQGTLLQSPAISTALNMLGFRNCCQEDASHCRLYKAFCYVFCSGGWTCTLACICCSKGWPKRDPSTILQPHWKMAASPDPSQLCHVANVAPWTLRSYSSSHQPQIA